MLASVPAGSSPEIHFASTFAPQSLPRLFTAHVSCPAVILSTVIPAESLNTSESPVISFQYGRLAVWPPPEAILSNSGSRPAIPAAMISESSVVFSSAYGAKTLGTIMSDNFVLAILVPSVVSHPHELSEPRYRPAAPRNCPARRGLSRVSLLCSVRFQVSFFHGFFCP